MSSRTLVKGHIMAFFSTFVWASVFVSVKVLLEVMSPVDILLYRFIAGYLFLWALKPRIFRTGSFSMECNFILGGLTGIAVNCLLESAALLYTGSAVVSVIVATSPFMVGLLAKFILGKKLTPYYTYGFILAIIGIAMICLTGNGDKKLHWLGELMSIGAALVWAVYGLFTEKINSMDFDTILVTRRLFFYGTLFMLPVYILRGGTESLMLLTQPLYLGNVVFLGVVACALAFLCWNRAIGIIGAVSANLYIYLLPVLTIFVAALILNERITFRMLLGTAFTLSGVVLSSYSGKKAEDEGKTDTA